MLIVVRHGRTTANAQGLLLGRLDPPLDEVGRAQASALGTAFDHVDRVVCSPLARTRETASAFDAPTTVDERWIEIDYGDWDGTPLRDLDADVWATWRADLTFRPPGGESLLDLGERVRAACDDLLEEAIESHIVVVSHVSPIKAALAWALGVGDEVAWRAFVAPASVTTITCSERGPSLHSFNGTAHLP